MKKRKLVIIGIEVSGVELQELVNGMKNMAHYLDYELVFTNQFPLLVASGPCESFIIKGPDG